jgi:hypothetical protein
MKVQNKIKCPYATTQEILIRQEAFIKSRPISASSSVSFANPHRLPSQQHHLKGFDNLVSLGENRRPSICQGIVEQL